MTYLPQSIDIKYIILHDFYVMVNFTPSYEDVMWLFTSSLKKIRNDVHLFPYLFNFIIYSNITIS